jgi:signal transduction histidine kinase
MSCLLNHKQHLCSKTPGRKLFHFVLFFFVLTHHFFSQNEADSLIRVFNNTPDDTNKVLLLDKILITFQQNDDLDSAISYGNIGVALAKRLSFLRGEADLYNDIANSYYLKGDYATAINYHHRAIHVKLKLNNKKSLGKSYNNLGSSYEKSGNYSKALENLIKSALIKEELKDTLGMIRTFNNIGNVYLPLKKPDIALYYFNKSLALSTLKKYEVEMGRTFSSMSYQYDDLKNFERSLYFGHRALDIFLKIDDKNQIAIIYNNLATYYDHQGKFDLSKDYYLKALQYWTEADDKNGIAAVSINLGQHYQKVKKDFTSAIRYFNISLENAGSETIQSDIYISLADIYQEMGDHKKAYEYLSAHLKIQKKLYNEISTQQIAEMQTKYETEKKEKENNDLKRKAQIQELEIRNETEKRKNQLTIAFAFSGLIALSSAFLYNRRKLKQKALHAAELAELEKNRFKDVIEAEEKERGRIAQELHDGLGQLLSTARLNVAGLEDTVTPEDKPYLDKSLKIIDEACVEVRNISHNMMPSALMRLGLISAIKELSDNINATGKIKIQLATNVSQPLGKSLDITIYRIVQEVLNNMIRHSKADLINLDITREGESLTMHIKDNGVGFDTQQLKHTKGIGWKNIFSRVSMLNGTIQLDSKPEEGTVVFIKLLLKNDRTN